MRNLHFNSLLLLLFFTGCVAGKDIGTPWESPFKGSFEKALFKTSLDIRKNHLSGYTLIKKTADSTFRIIFSNDMGMTIYDFELDAEHFKVNYLFEPMNKKVMVSIFERDFRQLIYGKEMSGKNFINKVLIRAEKGSDLWPVKIVLSNPGIKLEMQLRHMLQ